MKKKVLFSAIIAFMSVSVLTSFGQETDKKSEKARENLKEAKKDVVDAKKDLKVAQKDSVSDYQKFKRDSESKIRNNEKTIADLKVKHAKMTDKENVVYQKKVSDLELKNTTMKKKLADYKNDQSQDKWVTFKTEFKHDMDELGKSMKDFTVKNTK
jgi:hypothetical protein